MEKNPNDVTEIHIVNFPTHAVKWTLNYGPGFDPQNTELRTRHGDPLYVWFDYCATFELAVKWADVSKKEQSLFSEVSIHMTNG